MSARSGNSCQRRPWLRRRSRCASATSALPHATLLEMPDLTHNLVDTRGPAEEKLLPLPDDVVSPTLVQAIATALHGSLKLAR